MRGVCVGLRGKLLEMRFLGKKNAREAVTSRFVRPFGVVSLPPLKLSSGLITCGFPNICPRDSLPRLFEDLRYVSINQLATIGWPILAG